MRRFREKELKEFRRLFLKHDKDSSGTLSKEELLPLLKEVAAYKKWAKVPDESDVEWVQDNCSLADRSAVVAEKEVKAVVAQWTMHNEASGESMVAPAPASAGGSSACVLL